LNSEKLEINNLSIFTHENFEQLNKVSKYSNIFRKSHMKCTAKKKILLKAKYYKKKNTKLLRNPYKLLA
jgi:hypothetical protein